jgi:hypothetical protein
MQMFGVDSFSLYLRVHMGCRSYDALQLAFRHTEQVYYMLHFHTCINTVIDWGFRETNRISSNRARLFKMLQRLNCSFNWLDSAIYSVTELQRKCMPKKWFWFAEFLWSSLSSTWRDSTSLVFRQPSEIVYPIKANTGSIRICNYWLRSNALPPFFLCLDLCLPTYCRCRGYCCTW